MATTTTVKLQLDFNISNADSSTGSARWSFAKVDAAKCTEANVKNIADAIIDAADSFEKHPTTLKAAKVVTTTETDIEMNSLVGENIALMNGAEADGEAQRIG